MSCTVRTKLSADIQVATAHLRKPMIKSISLLARRDHLSHDQFVLHWVDIHVPMSHEVPGLSGYAISHITDTLTHPHAPLIQMPREIDGIAETWADSTEAQARMAASPEAQAWFADGAKFIGHVKSFRTEETTVIKPVRGPAPIVKAISFIARKKSYSPEAFLRHWIDIHGTMALTVPGLRGFVLSRIIAEPNRPDVPTMELNPPIDGIAEAWFDSHDARLQMAQTAEAQRWFADGGLFIGQITSYLTTEQVVIPPPGG
jgi:uncharacterized protein (TIGR02118 family)